jgi:hypothetical protein
MTYSDVARPLNVNVRGSRAHPMSEAFKVCIFSLRGFVHAVREFYARTNTHRAWNSQPQASWPPSVHEIIYVYRSRFGCILISFLKDAKYAHESNKLSVCPMLRLILTKLGMDVTQRMSPHHCILRHMSRLLTQSGMNVTPITITPKSHFLHQPQQYIRRINNIVSKPYYVEVNITNMSLSTV